MWTPSHRKNYSRNGLRYQSNVTDEEWRVIEPYLPPAKGIGRPRGWPLREIVNGIFYVMRPGCPWRQLPKDPPPWSRVDIGPCITSEHFGQEVEQFKRVSGSSGLNVRLRA